MPGYCVCSPSGISFRTVGGQKVAGEYLLSNCVNTFLLQYFIVSHLRDTHDIKLRWRFEATKKIKHGMNVRPMKLCAQSAQSVYLVELANDPWNPSMLVSIPSVHWRRRLPWPFLFLQARFLGPQKVPGYLLDTSSSYKLLQFLWIFRQKPSNLLHWTLTAPTGNCCTINWKTSILYKVLARQII